MNNIEKVMIFEVANPGKSSPGSSHSSISIFGYFRTNHKHVEKWEPKRHCRRGASPPHPKETGHLKADGSMRDAGGHRQEPADIGENGTKNPVKFIKIRPKTMENGAKIDKKSMKNRGGVADAFGERFGSKKVSASW